MIQIFVRLLLLLVLTTGQWAYAEHNADIIGGTHSHTTDCAICLNQVSDFGSLPSPHLFIDHYQSTDSFRRIQHHLFSAVFYQQNIRAPPVSQ